MQRSLVTLFNWISWIPMYCSVAFALIGVLEAYPQMQKVEVYGGRSPQDDPGISRMVFLPKDTVEIQDNIHTAPGHRLLQAMLGGTLCDHQNKDRMLQKLRHHVQVNPDDLNKVNDILNKLSNDTVVCRIRHGLGERLLAELHIGQNGAQRQVRSGLTEHKGYVCTEDIEEINTAEEVQRLRSKMAARKCLGDTSEKYVSRILQLLDTADTDEKSSEKLLRLRCQLAKKFRFCSKRAELWAEQTSFPTSSTISTTVRSTTPSTTASTQSSTVVTTTTAPASTSTQLTAAEIHFLNNWPAPYEIKNRDELEMIFY